MDAVIKNYVIRKNGKAVSNPEPDICMFCGSSMNITKEHVIPKWLFENNPKKFFTTDINGLNQTYNKTTVPACANCNNDLLGNLESYINKLFQTVDLKKSFFSPYEIQNIVRWLEIIDYKFQILNIRRRFLTSKEGGFIPYLADFPISMLRYGSEYDSPSKVVTAIRRSQKKLSVKDKSGNLNSLVVFHTTNKDFHFFHTMNDFIFLELPKHGIAFLYFYNRAFTNTKRAHKAAMKIINKVYN